MPSSFPYIQIDHLTSHTNSGQKLQIKHFSLKKGEHFAILGPARAGKTSLTQLLRFELPFQGSLQFKQTELPKADELKRSISCINFKKLKARPALSIEEFLTNALTSTFKPTKDWSRKTEQFLSLCELLDQKDLSLLELSELLYRKALIARELVTSPELLILDEPCFGLNLKDAQLLRQVLNSLTQLKLGLMVLSQDVADVLPGIKRVAFLKEGQLIADGPKQDLLKSKVLSQLFECSFFLYENRGWYSAQIVSEFESAAPHANDEAFMKEALAEAQKAASEGEVPVGAVVVFEGKIIARAHNRRETDEDPAAHAEFLAMEEASRLLGRWRLWGCTLYVTLEPCLMCAGLALNARVERVVYGAVDEKAGAMGSLYDVGHDLRFNHQPELCVGVGAAESEALLHDFFEQKRKKAYK